MRGNEGGRRVRDRAAGQVGPQEGSELPTCAKGSVWGGKQCDPLALKEVRSVTSVTSVKHPRWGRPIFPGAFFSGVITDVLA